MIDLSLTSLKRAVSQLHRRLPIAEDRFVLMYNELLRADELTYFKTVEAALRDCARIPVKEFALVVLLESGEERYYSSQSLTPYQPRIFTERFKQDFRRNVHRSITEGSYPNSGWLKAHLRMIASHEKH